MDELIQFLKDHMVTFEEQDNGNIYIHGRKGVDLTVSPSWEVIGGFHVRIIRPGKDGRPRYIGEMLIRHLSSYIEKIVTRGIE